MKIYFLFILLLISHIFILANIQFTAWPEMFSYPYLSNNDFVLYKDQALPYQPLLVLILSKIYMIFGYDINVLKIFTWAIILLNDILIFLISRKIINKKLFNFIPLVFYILVQGVAGGNMLWFDLATVPFILGAIYLLITFNSTKKYFIAGLFLGCAALIKQQMLAGIAILTIYFLFKKNFSATWRLLLGFLAAWFLILIWVFQQGVWQDYIFWTFTVPFFWYPQFPGYANWPTKFQVLQTLILFSGIFFVLKDFKKWSETTWILFLTFVVLFLTAFPRFDFFRMQPSIALFPILYAIILNKRRIYVIFLILSALLFLMISQKDINFSNNVRFYEKNDLELSKKISLFLDEGNLTYFLGVHSGQYILTKTFPVKPWVDNYVWYMEIPDIQDKVIDGLEKGKPKYIFWQLPQSGQWFDLGTYQPQKITEYIKINYTKFDEINGSIEVWQKN